MASKKTQKLQLSEQEAMGKKTVGRKRKGKYEKDALMLTDTEDEDVPLAQAFSSNKKKKKTEGTSKDQAIDTDQDKEVAAEPVEDQTVDDQAKKTPTPKRRKQKAKRTLEIVEVEQNPEPVEKTSEPEKAEGSKKKKHNSPGKEFIKHNWFNDFQTYGIWLDGYASYPVGFSSLIFTQLLEKMKNLDCIVKLKSSSAWSMINKSEIAYPRFVKLFYINLKLKKGK